MTVEKILASLLPFSFVWFFSYSKRYPYFIADENGIKIYGLGYIEKEIEKEERGEGVFLTLPLESGTLLLEAHWHFLSYFKNVMGSRKKRSAIS